MPEMSPHLHIVSIIIAAGFIFYVIRIVRKETLQLRDSLVWFFIGLSFIVLALFPRTLRFIADLIGTNMGISALFLISSITAFVILFQHSISISRWKEANKKLSQEIALLKVEIERMANLLDEGRKREQ